MADRTEIPDLEPEMVEFPAPDDMLIIRNRDTGIDSPIERVNIISGSIVKVLYEGEADTNVFNDAAKTKLANIETGATSDQTGAEIKSLYEAEADTNAYTDSEKTKLANIEATADVTDATNVEAAGAVMEGDTSTALMMFVVDEDNMASDSPTLLSTQQSIKAYVDNKIASNLTYKGEYDAATNTPDLDVAPTGVNVGDTYAVSAAGDFFTETVEVGDLLIAEATDASTEAEWSILQKNLDAPSIKSAYESNADTNAYTDSEKAKLADLSNLILETTEKAADYTIGSGDEDLVVNMNVAGGGNLIVPADTTWNAPIGTIVGGYNRNIDDLTITSEAGVTVRNAGTVAQFGEVSLRKRAADEWVAAGAVV